MRLLVDTAITVPVNVLPLTDDTDFKSRETSVVYNAAGMDLVWNFVTPAGVQTQTAVTPTDTGGNYDWVNKGDGMYNIEIPASGGASINNDTEGYGWFTGVATGVLPWASPIFEFAPANIVNSLTIGSDKLQTDTVEAAGTAWNSGAIGPNTLASDTITAAKIAANALAAAKFAADAITAIQSGLATSAALTTVAGYLDTEIAAILADTNELQTDLADGGRLDLLIDAIKAQSDKLTFSTGNAIQADLRRIVDGTTVQGFALDKLFKLIICFLYAKSSGMTAGAGTTVIRDIADGANVASITVSSDGNKTASTVD